MMCSFIHSSSLLFIAGLSGLLLTWKVCDRGSDIYRSYLWAMVWFPEWPTPQWAVCRGSGAGSVSAKLPGWCGVPQRHIRVFMKWCNSRLKIKHLKLIGGKGSRFPCYLLCHVSSASPLVSLLSPPTSHYSDCHALAVGERRAMRQQVGGARWRREEEDVIRATTTTHFTPHLWGYTYMGNTEAWIAILT